MKIILLGIAIHTGFSIMVALPARAQSDQPVPTEFAVLERPVAFEISPSTGTLKETAQRGQELIWIRKDNPSDRRFQVSNISVGFLQRSWRTSENDLLWQHHVAWLFHFRGSEIERDHSHAGRCVAPFLELGFSVKCGDNNQPLTHCQTSMN
jgi:hypothetical protein